MSTQQIYQLIPKVMGDVGSIGKDRKNEQQGYKFRGIEDMYNAIHPALVKHGVFCAPEVLECVSTDRVTANGKPAIRVEMKVRHRFYAPDGSYIDVTTVGEGIDSSDKASNKCMSAAMKYAYIELFAIPTEDIADGDRDNPETGSRKSNVARIEQDIPVPAKGDVIQPPDDQLITNEDAKKLHRRFRESLSDDLKPQADALLHDFLGRKLIMDSHGNPSAKGIRKDEFVALGKEAVAFAQSLSEVPA